MKRRRLITALLTALLSTPAFAGYDEGYVAYLAGNYDHAFTEWKPLAEKCDAKAQFGLGELYRNGQGVPQDEQQAAAWLRKAAGHGIPLAQNNLGQLYREGKGVPQDDKQAIFWFRKAAEQSLSVFLCA